jgi:NAD(P)-dependent dehydrogenase (short-subunit alcohol dehydrogenase family)
MSIDPEATAVVTGGNSGIGRAVAHALAGQDCQVVIAARDEGRGQAVVEEIEQDGGEALFVRTDVRESNQVERLMERAAEEGPLTYLFNNAGYEGPVAPPEHHSEDDVHQIVDTNLKGAFFGVQHAVPHMEEGGRVVNNASFAGTIPFEPGVLYGATKSGLIHLTQSLAAVHEETPLQFYAVCPYNTDAPMIERVAEDMGAPPAALGDMNPSGELADPEEVAEVVTDLFAGTRDLENGGALLVDKGPEVTPVNDSY